MEGKNSFGVVGILGGGQLGRMTATVAQRLGYQVHIVEPNPAAPCSSMCHHQVVGDFKDPKAIKELAAGKDGVKPDVVTVEIEHVNCDALDELVAAGVTVKPLPDTIRIIQDKYRQKVHFSSFESSCGEKIKLVDYKEVPEGSASAKRESIREFGQDHGFPLMLKAKRGAYDGRGNRLVYHREELSSIEDEWLEKTELYLEAHFDFEQELAVNVVCGKDGIFSFPTVETYHSNNICHAVVAPARVSHEIAEKARRLAELAVMSFGTDSYGVYGVELFWDGSDQVVVNEIAPRPHNSGHYTIEACDISQFEAHVRAIMGLKLWTPKMIRPVACMLNTLGANRTCTLKEDMNLTRDEVHSGQNTEDVYVHWYGKKFDEKFRGRKIGHITVTGNSYSELVNTIKGLVVQGVEVPDSMRPAGVKSPAQVAVIMGSDSDLPTMKAAVEILEQFDISTEVTIVSAHRTPERMFKFAREAHTRGIKVIIAGAGGAAHLPGMVASMTPLPVIGVPVKLATLDGQDSLLSIVQMPRGVPVATVAINNSTNAGLLAVRMVGASNPKVLEKMMDYQNEMRDTVEIKAERLERCGWKTYMEDNLKQ